jgi:hypothetical protein
LLGRALGLTRSVLDVSRVGGNADQLESDYLLSLGLLGRVHGLSFSFSGVPNRHLFHSSEGALCTNRHRLY